MPDDDNSGEAWRLRVDEKVEQREVVLDELLKSEDIIVERVPVGAIVKEAPPPRQEGDTLVIPLVEEEIFVKRRLVVREEVRITKKQGTLRYQERLTLLAEDAVVRREKAADEDQDRADFDALPSFRKRD
jgi:stress response protein YsnF